MTTRIEQRFADLRAAGRKGFIPYITAGDPNIAATEEIIFRLEDAGADIIELGVPFSDPLADGTDNQLAAARGLASGTNVRRIFEMVRRVRERSEIPLVLYSYINPLFAPGFGKVVAQAARAGLDGMLIVDMALEEAGEFRQTLSDHRLNCINLVTPTTPDARLAAICKLSNGFVYCVSRAGTTGAQQALQQQAKPLLKRTHRHTDLPVALGFGVSTPEQARSYARITEAVVVGSYIVNQYFQAGDSAAGRARATKVIKRLIDAVKEV